MVRPTARVLALLELLQGGGTHTVADLARRLAVDERTVRRYAEHLRDLDIPVDAVRGRYGGYRLARHYRMPPLMLTDEEGLAVVWGLLLSSQSGSGPASLAAVESAVAKVRRVLPAVLARRIDAVIETVGFTARDRTSTTARTAAGTTAARASSWSWPRRRETDVRSRSGTRRGRAGRRSAPCNRTASSPIAVGSTSPGSTSRGTPSGRSASTASTVCACSTAPSPCPPTPTRCSRSSVHCRGRPGATRCRSASAPTSPTCAHAYRRRWRR